MSSQTPPTPPSKVTPAEEEKRILKPNFITEIVERDLREQKYGHIVTRFPPEPNGYLHIGHAKAICIDFGVAHDYGGHCNLRMDDTNPTGEDMEYAEAIQRDIEWLGFDCRDNLFFASDYFETLYQHAITLIEQGNAYVDSASEEEIREYRGTITEPGKESPYRTRSVEENLDLFRRMREGEFAEGAHVLRAKIDMAHPNMIMRDPILYRIRHAHHYRTADAWPIYPLYDFAHCLSDAIEGVTHSLCTLEFENNREIYDWLVDHLYEAPRPYQHEFGRHNIEYTVLSKRRLVQLVREGHVTGWDDPRMYTLTALRRRGVTPEAVLDFVNRIGVSRSNSVTSVALLEHSVRDDLNTKAPRVMAVVDPLKVVITNYPAGQSEQLEAPYWPHDVPREGSRQVPFSRELYIEREDFMKDPPKGYKRLSPGDEVRLRHAYVIRCDEVIKDASGSISELRCSYDPDTLGKNPTDRKVTGAIHWVSAPHALPVELRLYDRLFTVPNPSAGEKPFTEYLNPDSLVIKRGFVEPSVKDDPQDTRYQFERQGYFWQDPKDSASGALVFNRIVTLRDSWAKRTEKQDQVAEAPQEKPSSEPAAQATETERDLVAELNPDQKAVFERYTGALGLSEDDAVMLAGNAELGAFFEDALRHHDNPQGIANWIVNDLWREAKGTGLEALPVTPQALAELVALIDQNTITSRIAKEVFAEMLQRGDEPRGIVKERGLEQIADPAALTPIVDKLIANNPDKVTAYRAGKTGLKGFFVGQVMRQTGGKANPQLVQELVEDRLKVKV